MRVGLLESFYGGSHRKWVDGLVEHSHHELVPHTLPGAHWKWRMHGAAVSFARMLTTGEAMPSVLLVSGLCDLAALRGVLAREGHTPRCVLYMHENQLTYPWSPADPDPALHRDAHYAWIHFTSVLSADQVVFNSRYHRSSFLGALPDFLRQFPDRTEFASGLEHLHERSSVIAPGLDIRFLERHRQPKDEGPPICLWNHRWEFDKNPEPFFRALITLSDEGVPFRLVVLGEQFRNSPAIFQEAREKLSAHILHWGYCADPGEYARWLWRSHLLPVTARQDFFGYSVVEALHCGVVPLLPRRLAYPEHSPEPHHFYTLDEDFLPRLRSLLSAIGEAPAPPSVHHHGWASVIGEYDRMLAEVAR